MLSASSSGSSIPAIEPGIYPAVCYTVADLGSVYSDMYGTTSRKVVLIWEIPDLRIEVEGQDLPRVISKQYTLSVSEKANLRKDLVSWRGKDLTPQEEENFEVAKVAGVCCQLNVIHKNKQSGGTYAKVDAVLPFAGKKFKPENPIVVYGIEEHGTKIPESLPQWVQDEIKKSPEYKTAVNPAEAAQSDPVEDDTEPIPDDEIPF